jgi:hypothetical protein
LCSRFHARLFYTKIYAYSGIVRIQNDSQAPRKITKLKIGLEATTHNVYPDRLDVYNFVKKSRRLVSPISCTLLRHEALLPGAVLNIPFELELPDPPYWSGELFQALRLNNLLPASASLVGKVIGADGSPFVRVLFFFFVMVVRTNNVEWHL